MDLETIREERTSLIAGFRKCGPLLNVIGDENRQNIMVALLETPGMRVEEVREHTNLSTPAVSHHLKIMKDAGLVVLCRKGRMNFYFPNCDPAVWMDLKNLADRICEVTEIINGNLDLNECRKVLLDEYQ